MSSGILESAMCCLIFCSCFFTCCQVTRCCDDNRKRTYTSYQNVNPSSSEEDKLSPNKSPNKSYQFSSDPELIERSLKLSDEGTDTSAKTSTKDGFSSDSSNKNQDRIHRSLDVIVNMEPTTSFLSSLRADQDMVDSETECSICLENFCLQDELSMLDCGHFYHMKCHNSWESAVKKSLSYLTCPQCRA